MPTEWDLAVRILIAVGLGAGIGLERELSGQDAGLRTHVSIAMGAALFGMVSAYSFQEFVQPRADTNYQVDVTRVASNVVTGVGFLGGGAIIKHGMTVRGLTTAASIWVTAAVGLAVGLGSIVTATVTAAVLLFVLAGLRWPRRWLNRRSVKRENVNIQLSPAAEAGPVVDALLKLPGVTVKSVSVRGDNGEGRVIRADIKGVDLHSGLTALSEHPGVMDIDLTP
ncbi:MAG: MgtC/SapB family protein [Actinobacteria bacterium]|nr:MgtC/SapB family protein [Actinomycetota bacterium]